MLVVLIAMGVSAGEAQAQDRYALAGGCYVLKSAATGKFVAKAADGGYRASADGAGGAEPFRMQATALGRYLLYGAKRDFMASASRARCRFRRPPTRCRCPGCPSPPLPRAATGYRASPPRARPPTGA